MQEYLSSAMAAKGNESSNIIYGIDIFKEKVYFPIKSSKDFVHEQNTPAGQVSLKNAGMTKETVPNASNPLVLDDFDDVWANHVGKMSTYHAFVVAIDNFNKIYNYSRYMGSTSDSSSVKTVLKSVFGTGVNEYITNMLGDINGGAIADKVISPYANLYAKYKKTRVALSVSVMLQQPTAIVRAMAMIDLKHFVGKNELSRKDTWEEMKKYAPIAVIKEIGGFDAGSSKQVSAYLTGDKTLMDKVDDFSMKGAEYFDQIGWNAIWNACKREAKEKGFSGVELLQEAGKRATEIIQYTQVYDSVLSRSGFMRSKADFVKSSVMFMGEPTTSMNMLYNAVLQSNRGKISKASASRTIGCVIASIILANAFKSIMSAGRDDDDDKSFTEKYVEKLSGNILSDVNILKMLPFANEAVSVFENWVIKRPDMSIFADLKQALDSLDSNTKSPYRKTEDLAGTIATFFGVAVGNVMRDCRSAYNIAKAILDDNTPTSEGIERSFVEGVTGKDANKQMKDELTSSMESGDTAKIKNAVQELLDSGKDKSSIKSTSTTYWKPIFLDAYAKNDNKTMENIRRSLYATGIYGSVNDAIITTQNWIKQSKK